MSMRRTLPVALLALGLGAGLAYSQSGPNLGQPITEADVGAWNITASPDMLPKGSGTPTQGELVYKEKCALCHGENGKGGTHSALVGSPPLNAIDAPRTITNFWGFATTVFDFTKRAMPWPTPRTLTDDEVYAVVAYILSENKLIGQNDVMNAQTLPKVQMPNAKNFIIRFPDRI
jgi:cytochrome c